MPGPAIGIDLGTTYSCVGIWQGCCEIIPNDQSNRITPSCVAFTCNDCLIGDTSKSHAAMDPENTVFDVKRLIGRKMDDSNLQCDLKEFPFKVIAENGKPRIQVSFKSETKIFSPEEISSMILTKMKETSEAYLGVEVKDAVITVPACFNNSQRQATKDAGLICGLNVLRIINEPTAAAIAYIVNGRLSGIRMPDDYNVLIYDLGGGTFDVSLIKIDDGVVEVMATAGDTHLGGRDFDNRLVSYVLQEFKRKHKKDPSDDSRALRRIRTACERAKRQLSSAAEATIEVDSCLNGIDFYANITRTKFEELCADLFRGTLDHVDKVLRDSQMSKGAIHDIVLVGGSTRIPKVQQLLQNFFNGHRLNMSLNPDEAVACGAAVQAAILMNSLNHELFDDIVTLDVVPFSLGIEVEGVMTKIIERNTSLPYRSKSKVFSTYTDNQPGVTINVYEGERQMARDNNLLGKFQIEGIPPAPRGVPQIEVLFDIERDGILRLVASELQYLKDSVAGTKKTIKNIIITHDKGHLSRREIMRMVKEAERFKEENERQRRNIDAKNSFESYCYSLKNTMQDDNGADKPDASNKTLLTDKFDEAIFWIENSKSAEVEEIAARQKELESVAMPIMTKIYQSGGAPGGMPDMGGMPGDGGPPPSGAGSAGGPHIEEVD